MSVVVARPVKRPSPLTGGWLPENKDDRLAFLKKILEEGRSHRKSQPRGFVTLDPTILELQKLIEDSAQLSMLFKSMFEEIPFSYRFDAVGEAYDIVNYKELLEHLDYLLDKPPRFNENMIIACPFTLLLEWPMATRGGLVAFLDKGVNEKFGAILNKWGAYLMTAESRTYIVNDPNDPDSWLSAAARDIMRERDPGHREFEDLFECKPGEPYLGFTSWDHFFTREFNKTTQPPVRPVEDTSDDTITSGCESAPYAIKQQVKFQEEFWIKGQPYSLKHMLASDADAKKYVGGTVYQAYLSPSTYHRWHSPINGVVKKLRIIEGSYLSISPINAFPQPETFANDQSQAYLSAVATRALIYLENSTVGEMVMIPIGMIEVSTCTFNETLLSKMQPVPNEPKTWVPKDGTTVNVSKGDELGMFHFGGSTHCLVFGPNVQLKFWQRAIPLNTEESYFVPLNAVLADVKKMDPAKKSIYG